MSMFDGDCSTCTNPSDSDWCNTCKKPKEWTPKIFYCEFNKHDYYALIAVKKDKPYRSVYQKAYKLYLEIVAGESIHELKQEGQYDELTKDQALLKFLLIDENKDKTVRQLVTDFEAIEDNVVLIDSSLV